MRSLHNSRQYITNKESRSARSWFGSYSGRNLECWPIRVHIDSGMSLDSEYWSLTVGASHRTHVFVSATHPFDREFPSQLGGDV